MKIGYGLVKLREGFWERAIKAFDKDNPEMTLSTVAKKTGMTRANARRLLLTLESIGYVEQRNNLFTLTWKVIELGYNYFASLPWTDLAYKNMKQVVNECKLTCSISILDGESVVFIMRILANRVLNEGVHIGTRFPAAHTATGRLFMLHMDDQELRDYIPTLSLQQYTDKSITDPEKLYEIIREQRGQNYYFISEELEDGLLALAVPIYNHNNKIIGAMSVGSHRSYKNSTYLKNAVLPMLLRAARDTSDAIKLLQHES